MQKIYILEDDTSRHYLIYVPDTYDKTIKTNIVFGFHGYGGTASGFESEVSGGFNKLTMGHEDQKVTVKESTLTGYTGGAGSQGYTGNMDKASYMNAETNPNKEIIAQGRMPTLSNTKVVNGGEHFNVEIKKIESDYMNQSENKLTRVYNSGPTTDQYDITTYKDKLDDTSIAGRIDKDLLNSLDMGSENPIDYARNLNLSDLQKGGYYRPYY